MYIASGCADLSLVALEGVYGVECDGVVDVDGVLHCRYQQVATVAAGSHYITLYDTI